MLGEAVQEEGLLNGLQTEHQSQAQQGRGADCFQRPLVPRSRFQQQLTPSVDMIDIASGCAKRTYTSDFWRNRCVNHSYFLICTQGKSWVPAPRKRREKGGGVG